MTAVTSADLLRYVEGEIEDPAELTRIEAALASDPALAAEYEKLQASLEPSPDVADHIRGLFQTLDASVWVRLQFPAPRAAGGEPEQARLELPDGQSASVIVRTAAEGVHLTIHPPVPGWRPASIALFHARRAGGGPMEVAGGEERNVAPGGLAAHAPHVRNGEPAFTLSADHEYRGWISAPATNALGGKAWLEDAADGLALVVNLSESAGPAEAARYHLQWPGGERSGTVPLVPAQGRRLGQRPLSLRAAEVRDAAVWRLQVEPVGAEQRGYVDAAQFRAVAGDDLQTLILTPAPAASAPQPSTLETPFQNDRQRALWHSGVPCWVRFERA